MRGAWVRALSLPLSLALLALAACNGTAVVTMTSTASPDAFLAYRVGLVSVQLEASSGKSGLQILPSSTTVDFAALTDVSEVLGAAAVAKGRYTSALITLDYSSAQIVYDDGSVDGMALTPVGANGKALGQIQLTVDLDPSDSFSISSKGASQLAMVFNLAASNVVDVSSKTVTVTPMIAASAMPIDTKPVRIRGPLVSVAGTAASTTATSSFTLGVMPFNGTVSGAGQLSIVTSDATTYEVNGSASTGSVGQSQLAGLGTGALGVAYGTLAAADNTTTTTTDGTTSTTSSINVSFTAAQVLAGSSVQGGGLDRVSGIVSARSGNILTIEDGTLVGADGSETFLGGTTTVSMGPNTAVTEFGLGGFNVPQQVSVGSSIDAFGVATILSSGNATLDASAGRVRLGNTTASGLVTAQGSGTLNLKLASLGGRAVAAFDFAGSAAAPGQYIVDTATLDLTNSTAGVPVVVTGMPNSFGVSPPNFIAATLLDPTTIQAELAVDWGTGTAAPFVTYDSSSIDLDVRNTSIGSRHQIQVGAQDINIVGLSADPSIVPDPTSSNTVFAIGHSVSSTIESFNTYAAFITQLQAELTGTTLALGFTATGQYTASTSLFTATSITLFLNN
jgi:hypothetical protein